MIEWLTWAQVVVGLAAGVLCVAFFCAQRAPNDYTLGAIALVELLLVVQAVTAIVAPFVGNSPSGDGLEFALYLITALLLPVLAVVWALSDRTRWSTLILAVVAWAVAIMVFRMDQIWTGSGL
ncbi:hypothetical protein GCM10022198_14220 [Klugiella xanthotipulae]|uniref:Integral membrane protein n=1 Tax=Klugiella xanthotipulae TaxID=244735 RepID=A0A543I4V3_9MICO|nr:hypothetical protein [Klugiella xanthotipulae]TQM65510.1 hypothetical protein FB466_0314 [Klugiella xanthotipulae]